MTNEKKALSRGKRIRHTILLFLGLLFLSFAIFTTYELVTNLVHGLMYKSFAYTVLPVLIFWIIGGISTWFGVKRATPRILTILAVALLALAAHQYYLFIGVRKLVQIETEKLRTITLASTEQSHLVLCAVASIVGIGILLYRVWTRQRRIGPRS